MEGNVKFKKCLEENGCGKIKTLNEFHKCKSNKDGHSNICKKCKAYRDKVCRSKNIDKIKNKINEWKSNNKEHIQQYGCDYYKENSESIIEYQKQHYQENKVIILAKQKIYNSEHKTEQALKKKKWAQENPEKVISSQQKFKENNPCRLREIKRKSKRKRRALKNAINENYSSQDEFITYQIFQNKCFKCGIVNRLSIDHHNCLNDGNPLTLENAVVLCVYCNSSKLTKKPKDFYSKSEMKRINELFGLALKLKVKQGRCKEYGK